jgi:hypothetical protein
MATIYKNKPLLTLSGYNGSVSNTFKTAYNLVQATPEDKVQTHSDYSGLGPIKVTFNGTRTFNGINSDGSISTLTLISTSFVTVKGFYRDFYITGGSVDLEVNNASGANPPYFNEYNQVQSNHLPEPLKGSGEI